MCETLVVNGVEFVKKESTVKGMPFVIIRGDRSGNFAGYLESRNGKEVVLKDSIRMHQWFGASLSQLSQEGTPDASKCRFAMPEKTKIITDAIEITECTEEAKKNLLGVKQWRL